MDFHSLVRRLRKQKVLAMGGFSVITAVLVLLAVGYASAQQESPGILYPIESESREVKSLDGIWNFRLAPRLKPDLGFEQQWFAQPLQKTGLVDLMPVPSSYNDITQSKEMRDHIGWAWYDRQFYVPSAWQTGRRIFLRVGAAHYTSIVYVNGEKVMEHAGGHLPFVTELDAAKLQFDRDNRVTIAINNTLTSSTVPQGFVKWQTNPRYPEGYFTLDYSFDFFNYGGIHRSVFLYTTPRTFIDDIDVTTRIEGTTGFVSYGVKTLSDGVSKKHFKTKAINVKVDLQDKDGNVVASGTSTSGELTVPNANLWWPYTMVSNDSQAGYLYTLIVTASDSVTIEQDVYRLNVGIRSVSWTNTQFLINGKPFYFRGFGRHEDSDIRGKGLDNALLVKDHNLIKWTGANSYRTSHYPYSEELMDLADKLGIVIIDEAPAVSINGFGAGLMANHKEQIREMIQRDKNRASVVMWSVANEPASADAAADAYFKEIIEFTRNLDGGRRPVTLVSNQGYSNDKSAKYVDILAINRYFGWYSDAGHTEVITKSMVLDVEAWVRIHNKPIMISEYGADTVAGLHHSPDFIFTEEFQTEYMREHFKAFDYLRYNSTLIGEHIWNFADFMTNQGITRVLGNKKGIFTRDRQPKASAHLLRHRYFLLASESDNYPLPTDLQQALPVFGGRRHIHDEH